VDRPGHGTGVIVPATAAVALASPPTQIRRPQTRTPILNEPPSPSTYPAARRPGTPQSKGRAWDAGQAVRSSSGLS
jgi:hypothetical protein